MPARALRGRALRILSEYLAISSFGRELHPNPDAGPEEGAENAGEEVETQEATEGEAAEEAGGKEEKVR